MSDFPFTPSVNVFSSFDPTGILLPIGVPYVAKVTLITGQNRLRGDVLGQISASKKYNLSLSAAGDGSQAPAAIMAADVDATAADKDAYVYLAGHFDATKLTFGTAHTAASTREAMARIGLYTYDSYQM